MSVNSLVFCYWSASQAKGYQLIHRSAPTLWKPPLAGEFKLNFDVTFCNGKAITGCVLRDSNGILLGAQVNHFVSDNPFCTESEEAIQALKLAEEIDKVTFKGDASNVILTLQGLQQIVDWKEKPILDLGASLLSQHVFWFLNYIPRMCNRLAHCLAKWAFSLDFCGPTTPNRNPKLWGMSEGN